MFNRTIRFPGSYLSLATFALCLGAVFSLSILVPKGTLAKRSRKSRSKKRKGLKFYKKAEALRLGSATKINLAKATEFYEKSCKAGYPLGCWRLAYMLDAHLSYPGKKITIKPAELIRLYNRACKGGVPVACASLGYFYKKGKGIPKNYTLAKKLFRKACRRRSGVGCYYGFELAEEAWEKKKRSKRQKRRWAAKKRRLGKKIKRYLYRACYIKKFEDACYLYGYLYYQGTYLKKNTKRAFVLLLKGCKLGSAESCDFLGLLYAYGVGVKKNYTLARKSHVKACMYFSKDGCMHAGGVHFHGVGGPKDFVLARKYYGKSCKWKKGQACLLLGEMYIRGEGGDRNVKGALKLYQKACKLKNKDACKRSYELDKILNPK